MQKRFIIPIVLLAYFSGCAAGSSYFDLTAPVENFAYNFSSEEMKLDLYIYDASGLKYSIDQVDDPGTIKSFQIVNSEWNVTAYVDGKMLEFGPSKKVRFVIKQSNDKVISFSKGRLATHIDFSADADDAEYKLQYCKFEEGA